MKRGKTGKPVKWEQAFICKWTKLVVKYNCGKTFEGVRE